MRKILYPGTFDPIHNGHIDIAIRTADLFDQLEFVVAVNPEKKTLFSFFRISYLFVLQDRLKPGFDRLK